VGEERTGRKVPGPRFPCLHVWRPMGAAFISLPLGEVSCMGSKPVRSFQSLTGSNLS